MRQLFQWTSGMILALVVSGSPVSAQEHGHQQMMMPRVPADKLAEARALQSPLPSSPDFIIKGKTIYEGKGTCVNCHGVNGRGDGPGAATLNPPPRVFRSHGFWRHRSEGEILDHTENMVLAIQLRNSEQMELFVSDAADKRAEIFEFGLKRLG